MTDILDVLTVERLDADVYRGHPVPTRMARTFGGQVAGQALMSATRTVSDEFDVHSLHGYFLRPGDPTDRRSSSSTASVTDDRSSPAG